MKVELNEITVRAVAENYVDNGELGVYGYGNKLNIRPKYQREFVYDAKKRDAVIDTISFCQYVNGEFSVDFDGRIAKFENLTDTEQAQILDYPLMVYFCEGNDKEKAKLKNICPNANTRRTPTNCGHITAM